jgi:TPR repeat protein
VKWYRKAAEQGVAEAQFALGCSYEFGDGVPANYEEATKWFRKAADQGDAAAESRYRKLTTGE